MLEHIYLLAQNSPHEPPHLPASIFLQENRQRNFHYIVTIYLDLNIPLVSRQLVMQYQVKMMHLDSEKIGRAEDKLFRTGRQQEGK
jgi:hypothetical protein